MYARPLFRGRQQSRAGSEASLPIGYDQTVYLGAHFGFEQRLLAHM
jgi:hypothetical protein